MAFLTRLLHDRQHDCSHSSFKKLSCNSIPRNPSDAQRQEYEEYIERKQIQQKPEEKKSSSKFIVTVNIQKKQE